MDAQNGVWRMCTRIVGLAAVWVCVLFGSDARAIISDDNIIFARGDANHDGVVDTSDPIYISNYIYSGGPEPPCMNGADANHDGQIDGADISYLLDWLHEGGSAPPAPGPYNTECTESAEPFISCEVGC